MRAIPENNLAYPILIQFNNGNTGSGFFVNDGSCIWLVTAKHVLFNIDSKMFLGDEVQLISYSKNTKDFTQNIIQLRLTVLVTSRDLIIHPTQDIIVVRIGTIEPHEDRFKTQLVDGATLLQASQDGLIGVAESNTKLYDEIFIGNEVVVFGFPTSLGLQSIPQIDLSKPLLRRGIIAGINPLLNSIILDCPVYPGNSGGPVLEIEQEGLELRYRVIGIVSQFVPYVETWVNLVHKYTNTNIANSGYSVVVPINFALDLIHQFNSNQA